MMPTAYFLMMLMVLSAENRFSLGSSPRLPKRLGTLLDGVAQRGDRCPCQRKQEVKVCVGAEGWPVQEGPKPSPHDRLCLITLYELLGAWTVHVREDLQAVIDDIMDVCVRACVR
jgi:hypothetical protein